MCIDRSGVYITHWDPLDGDLIVREKGPRIEKNKTFFFVFCSTNWLGVHVCCVRSTHRVRYYISNRLCRFVKHMIVRLPFFFYFLRCVSTPIRVCLMCT